jgi:hypothetical protein
MHNALSLIPSTAKKKTKKKMEVGRKKVSHSILPHVFQGCSSGSPLLQEEAEGHSHMRFYRTELHPKSLTHLKADSWTGGHPMRYPA